MQHVGSPGAFDSKRAKVTIIAEVGSNHDGDLNRALAHIDAAAEAGADVVKFQSFLADDLVSTEDSNYSMLKRFEMPRRWYPVLIKRCAKRRVRFLSTATNFTTLSWMEEYGAWGYKVASANITHEPMIERLVEIGKPVIFSLGLATFDEVKHLTQSLADREFRNFAVLHCVSRYPTPPEALCLGNIPMLAGRLDCPVGFSDHSLGIEAPIAAVALGAKIIEKHFSLTGNGLSPDHVVALRPSEFSEMCVAIRKTELSIAAHFEPNPREIHDMRRSLHFVRAMKAGEIVAEKDIKVIRPEDGLLPRELNRVIGLRLLKNVSANTPVVWEMLDVELSEIMPKENC